IAWTSCWGSVRLWAPTNWWGSAKAWAPTGWLGSVKVWAPMDWWGSVKERVMRPAQAPDRLGAWPQEALQGGRVTSDDASRPIEYAYPALPKAADRSRLGSGTANHMRQLSIELSPRELRTGGTAFTLLMRRYGGGVRLLFAATRTSRPTWLQ